MKDAAAAGALAPVPDGLSRKVSKVCDWLSVRTTSVTRRAGPLSESADGADLGACFAGVPLTTL